MSVLKIPNKKRLDLLTVENLCDNKLDITEIILPEGLEAIRENTFQGFRNLKKINFPSSLTAINKYAFDGCQSLEYVELNEGLEFIGSFAFNDCSIENIYIPSTVEGMCNAPFCMNQNLKEITVSKDNPTYSDCDCNVIYNRKTDTIVQGCKTSAFPNNTKTIGSSAFYRCRMDELVIPFFVQRIGDYAFGRCNIKKLTLNENLEKIWDYAFVENKNLKEVVIPKNVNIIKKGAFFNCGLEKVTIKGNADIMDNVFMGNDNLKEIYIQNDWDISSTEYTSIISPKMINNKKTIIYTKDVNTSDEFYETYKDQIYSLTLDNLIEQGKSFKEANNILKEAEQTR